VRKVRREKKEDDLKKLAYQPVVLQRTVRSDQSILARSKPPSIHRTPATRSRANQPKPTHHTDLHHNARRVDTPRARADRREEREERRGTLTWDRMKAIGSEPGVGGGGERPRLCVDPKQGCVGGSIRPGSAMRAAVIGARRENGKLRGQ
jgi:hypothetical protein